MSRTLKRVPLTFDWPLKKVWKGFINPFYKLCGKCRDCDGSGYSPRAKRFNDEWYGYVEFDAVAYGAKPLTVDHPKIHALAVRNVNRSPDFFMTPEEQRRERENLQRAGVDLAEVRRTPDPYETREFSTEEPPPGLIRIDSHRGPAIEREQKRLFEVCFKHHWSHHLIQADVDALVADGRLMDFTHRPLNQEQAENLKQQESAGGSAYWLKEPNGYHPTADEVNDWSLDAFGHDGINQWVCIKARCAREGVPATCATCGGSGERWSDVNYDYLPVMTGGLLAPEALMAIRPVGKMVPGEMVKKLCEEWKDYEPPVGDGYQLWETCSEGSPVSPVFATLDELCAWCEDNATTFGSETATKEEWRKMLDEDFVCHRDGDNIFM